MTSVPQAIERLTTYATKVCRRAEILRRFADQQSDQGYQATADNDAVVEEQLAADLRTLLTQYDAAVKALRAIADVTRHSREDDGEIIAFMENRARAALPNACEHGWRLDFPCQDCAILTNQGERA